VRPLRREDVPRVLHILNEAAEGEVSASSLEVYVRDACVALCGEQIALVAEASSSQSPLDTPTKQVVGLVGLLLADELKPAAMKLDGARCGYVTNLAVASTTRREGVGTALLLAAEDAARRAGCVGVACRVDEDNVAARSMYDCVGYSRDAVEPKQLRDFRSLMGTLYGLAVGLYELNAVYPQLKAPGFNP
jgi:ribosomal protein S18 acetylase RimI-like enzyme